MVHNYTKDCLAYRENEVSPSAISRPAYVLVPPKKRSVYAYFKRFFDIISVVLLIPLLSPLFLLISVLIKVSSPGKVIFKQTRIGRYGKQFTLYKFRTMKENAPPDLATSEFRNADQYITKTGKFLRKSSLDELPQLFNILVGNMTLIGPRPLVVAEKEIHELRFSRGIYYLKPGVTGLAQINGRDLVKPAEKVYYDEQYLKSFSFKTDLKIFFKTIYIVLSRKGVVDGCDFKKRNESDPQYLRRI